MGIDLFAPIALFLWIIILGFVIWIISIILMAIGLARGRRYR